MKNIAGFIVKIGVMTVSLTLLYFLWTQTTNTGNLLLTGGVALIISLIFHRQLSVPAVTIKKIVYSIWYIIFLFIEIIKANMDVAFRVIKPVIPINPGIVSVRTKLKSPIGRMALANSITLTPGTLTVDIKEDKLYIHWIDVTDLDEEAATRKIVSGFEKYLEVIFG